MPSPGAAMPEQQDATAHPYGWFSAGREYVKEVTELILNRFIAVLLFLGLMLGGVTPAYSADITIDDLSMTEGSGNTVNMNFVLTLSSAAMGNETVDYEIVPDTAEQGIDYSAGSVSGTLAFGAGNTTVILTVPLVGDLVDEADETFYVDLSSPVNATIGDSRAVGTIVDNDAPPSILIFDATVTELDAGTVDAVFTVSLSGASSKTVTVDYATYPISAAATGDYTPITATTLTFAPGETVKTITVEVIGDTLDEDNETYAVLLSNAGNASIADSQGVGAITDDDDPPEMSIFDADVTEGDSGFTDAAFTVSLTAASGKTVTVDYATSNDSAAGGSDYMIIGTTTLSFAPGETVKTITVPVIGDAVDEDNETFNVTLTDVDGAVLVDDQAVGIIRDNDTFPGISVSDVAVVEGDAGSVNANLTVALAWASGKIVTVDYTVTQGTATPGSDYTSPLPGTLTFNPGETSKSVSVSVIGDTADEDPETFEVNLSNAAYGVINDATGVGTINDDDDTPALSIYDAAVTEGNVGTMDAIFTVSLSRPSGKVVTVDYATEILSATPGTDYTSLAGTTLTFNPGETVKTIAVPVIADTLDEDNETFGVILTNGVNAVIADNRAVGAINDDDAAAFLSISDVEVTERDAGTVKASFIVSLFLESGKSVTVDYATEAVTAVAENDFTGVGTATLTFAPGETEKTIEVSVSSDIVDEEEETFYVNLFNNNYGMIADARGVCTIIDNDSEPSLSIDHAQVTEGDEGTVDAVFSVTLSAASERIVTVDYRTVTGTASAGSDYAPATATTLTFDPGETEKNVSVPVVGDRLDEADESFTVELFNARNSVILQSVGLGVIIDDEAPEMIVRGNDLSIVDGDGTPSALDHTDFGEADIKSGLVVRVFTIANMGSAELLLTGEPLVSVEGAAAAEFTVTAEPSTPLSQDAVTTFAVTFDPSAVGPRKAYLSIQSTDPAGLSYDFAIQGTGVPAPSVVTEDNQRVLEGEHLTSSGSYSNVIVDGGGFVANSGTLVDLTNNGTVTGGTLAGYVINSGILSDVNLDAGTVVDGGTVSGTVSGSGEIRNALVNAIAMGSVTLGRGVILTEMTAENNPGMELMDVIRGAGGIGDPDVDLLMEETGQNVSLNDLIAEGVNGFIGNFDTVNQTLANGNITIDNGSFGDMKVICTLRSVVTTGEPDHMEMTPAGEILIVQNHVAVSLVPAPADRSSFLGGLLGMGILANIDPFGVVTFEVPGGERFSLRFDFTTRVNHNTGRSDGGAQTASFLVEGDPAFRETYRIKAIYPDGTIQFLPPYVHDPGQFRDHVEAAGLNYRIDSFTGIILLLDEQNRILWRGIPDYILYDSPGGAAGIDLIEAGDLNGDGRMDYGMITAAGAQPIYTLP